MSDPDRNRHDGDRKGVPFELLEPAVECNFDIDAGGPSLR
jgi:hypothetical protein